MGTVMRGSVLAIIAVFAVISTNASFGEDAAHKAAPNTAASPDNGQKQQDEMICKRVTLTGTLLPGPKICKSRKIWEQQQQDSKDLLNNATTRALQGNPPGG